MQSRYSAFEKTTPVRDRSYSPQSPSWNTDGTPANEDALQITAWIMAALRDGQYQQARTIWKNRKGKCNFASAYPGIETGISHMNTAPRREIERWIDSRAQTPCSRGVRGWRELLRCNLSTYEIYWRGSDEVRRQIEDSIMLYHDDADAKEPRISKPYIDDLREYVATKKRRQQQALDAVAKAGYVTESDEGDD